MYITQYHTVLYYITSNDTTLHHTILHCFTSYQTTLHYTTLHYTTLHYMEQQQHCMEQIHTALASAIEGRGIEPLSPASHTCGAPLANRAGSWGTMGTEGGAEASMGGS